ncbi:MAG TPA: hypothetical protein VN026_09575 [Bacteroidia bacterium]|nr:hypothetical protein [Bacteroidia bacterium]
MIATLTACRKPYNCSCITMVPGVDDVTTNVTITNTKSKANEICTSFGFTSAGTASTTCVLK